MFGVVRPCRHRLRGPLFGQWMAHLCGLCLTLRDLHGQNARFVTNYDGLLVSVLTEAQNPAVTPHRTAGPCALRGFRRADVLDASGSGARLAATVSLVLAAGKMRDHIADGDGAYARRVVAAGGGLAASRWQRAGARTGAGIGFDTGVLTDAIGRQAALERSAGLTLTDVTEPTETAVGAAFAQTAVLAGQPGNAGLLTTAGLSFGRIAHLIDAVEDLPDDRASGSYNPLLATGTTLAAAREHCDSALGDLRARSPGSTWLSRYSPSRCWSARSAWPSTRSSPSSRAAAPPRGAAGASRTAGRRDGRRDAAACGGRRAAGGLPAWARAAALRRRTAACCAMAAAKGAAIAGTARTAATRAAATAPAEPDAGRRAGGPAVPRKTRWLARNRDWARLCEARAQAEPVAATGGDREGGWGATRGVDAHGLAVICRWSEAHEASGSPGG